MFSAALGFLGLSREGEDAAVTRYPRRMRGWAAALVFFAVGCDGAIGTDDASTADASNDVGYDATTDVMPADATLDTWAFDASSDETSAPPTDAGTPDASACIYNEAGKGNPGYCNNLPESNLVNIGCVSSLPAAQGGTIVDGLYYLTSADWVSKADGGGCFANQTRRDTIEVCGNVMLWLDLDTVNSSYDGNMTFTTANDAITVVSYCSGGSPPMPYTATSTTLTVELDYPNNGPTLLLTLTRQ